MLQQLNRSKYVRIKTGVGDRY